MEKILGGLKSYEDNFEGIVPYPSITVKGIVIMLALLFLVNIIILLRDIFNTRRSKFETNSNTNNSKSKKVEISKVHYIWLGIILSMVSIINILLWTVY